MPVEYRRRGYGSAIVGRLIHTARHILHLHQVYVCVGVENKASIALFEKMGFATTARLTDWLCVGSAYQDALWMRASFSSSPFTSPSTSLFTSHPVLDSYLVPK